MSKSDNPEVSERGCFDVFEEEAESSFDYQVSHDDNIHDNYNSSDEENYLLCKRARHLLQQCTGSDGDNDNIEEDGRVPNEDVFEDADSVKQIIFYISSPF